MQNIILPDEICVFYTRISEPIHPNRVVDFLAQDELQRARKFKNIADKNLFVTGRVLLRKVISSYLPAPSSEIKLVYNFGKPEIHPAQNPSNIKFNLSHSSDLILFSFCIESDTGIDIEKIDTAINHLELAEQFCSEDEYCYIRDAGDQNELVSKFFRIWTRKEAAVKALGTGVSSMKNVSVLNEKIFTPSGTVLNILDLQIDHSYKSAVAYSGPQKKVIINELGQQFFSDFS